MLQIAIPIAHRIRHIKHKVDSEMPVPFSSIPFLEKLVKRVAIPDNMLNTTKSHIKHAQKVLLAKNLKMDIRVLIIFFSPSIFKNYFFSSTSQCRFVYIRPFFSYCLISDVLYYFWIVHIWLYSFAFLIRVDNS